MRRRVGVRVRVGVRRVLCREEGGEEGEGEGMHVAPTMHFADML